MSTASAPWPPTVMRVRLSNDALWSRVDLEWLLDRSISWRVRLPLHGEAGDGDRVEAVLSVVVASRLGEPCVACAHLSQWPHESEVDALTHALIVWARRALASHRAIPRMRANACRHDDDVNALEALWLSTTTQTRGLTPTRPHTSPGPGERATITAATSPTAPTRPALPPHDED